jgi:hypothetical protein
MRVSIDPSAHLDIKPVFGHFIVADRLVVPQNECYIAQSTIDAAPKAFANFLGHNLHSKVSIPEPRDHARPWLIDGVRSTSSAEVFETSAVSCGLSLIKSSV